MPASTQRNWELRQLSLKEKQKREAEARKAEMAAGMKLEEVSFTILVGKSRLYPEARSRDAEVFRGFKEGDRVYLDKSKNVLGTFHPSATHVATIGRADEKLIDMWIKDAEDAAPYPPEGWSRVNIKPGEWFSVSVNEWYGGATASGKTVGGISPMAKTGAEWATQPEPPSFAEMEERTKAVATEAERKRIIALLKKMAKAQKGELFKFLDPAELNHRTGLADGLLLAAHTLAQEGKA